MQTRSLQQLIATLRDSPEQEHDLEDNPPGMFKRSPRRHETRTVDRFGPKDPANQVIHSNQHHRGKEYPAVSIKGQKRE